MDANFNPYEVLGVDQDTPLQDIKKLYRKKVLDCHPDKVQDEIKKEATLEEFRKVQKAYEILSDDAQRELWDRQLRLAELEKELQNLHVTQSCDKTSHWTSKKYTVDNVQERVPRRESYSAKAQAWQPDDDEPNDQGQDMEFLRYHETRSSPQIISMRREKSANGVKIHRFKETKSSRQPEPPQPRESDYYGYCDSRSSEAFSRYKENVSSFELPFGQSSSIRPESTSRPRLIERVPRGSSSFLKSTSESMYSSASNDEKQTANRPRTIVHEPRVSDISSARLEIVLREPKRRR
ncbi:DnaJ domain-containing protein [Penicillium macrosclerotiorum]|uniref:DnaJ domain-containing protein n=1 Tax=Penicillium macrosclerotiorum TaxID=303699 RepID=UPI002547ED44|nr:DnaJ domain-containing protein [Penicillium macrosclerotiorum]KAJ5669014.1 DnaJ domain-containing protein [Penicillium macrosclerotiorum]